MNLFLLADSGIWYIWPETTASDILQVLVYIALFIILILLGRLIFLRRKDTKSSWTHILSYAYNRKLASKEISVLEHFFDNLDLPVKEKANLIDNKKVFQSYLYKYLKKYHSDSVESYVRIIDKLFPRDNLLEIKSLMDIHVGEVCSIDYESLYYMARVINRTDTEIMLSISNNAIKRDKEGMRVNLYFYRNEIGGFLIPGLVKKVNTNGIVFSQDGDIQTKGEEHLIAEITKEVQLYPWGVNTQDSSITLHNKTSLASDQETNTSETNISEIMEVVTEPESVECIKAMMIRISDRAILITIKDPFFNEAVLKKVDIWEMPLDLAVGFLPIVLKGKILKSNQYSDSYIFKFVAPSESDMKCIFDEIKKHKHSRGFIS